jgi:Ca2+-binding RTX toxin-like protein
VFGEAPQPPGGAVPVHPGAAAPGGATITLLLAADGSFRYLAREDFIGSDSFTYRAVDGLRISAVATVTVTVGAGCGGQPATVVGSPGADRLAGTADDDVIAALGGSDKVQGGGGHDLVCGGSGNDIVNADAGADALLGGSGSDLLRGDSGDDALNGGPGSDTCHGDLGTDTATACELVRGVP